MQMHFDPMTDMRFNHLGVAVAEIAPALAFYGRAFGFVPLTDVYHDPIQEVRVVFIGTPQDFSARNAEGFVLELIEPGGADSHLNRLLKTGGNAYHVCYAVADLEAAMKHLVACGCLKVRGPEPAAAYRGKPIGWCYAPSRHLIELVQL